MEQRRFLFPMERCLGGYEGCLPGEKGGETCSLGAAYQDARWMLKKEKKISPLPGIWKALTRPSLP